MKKSSVVNYYYTFICNMSDLNISYKKAYSLLGSVLNGNKMKSKHMKGDFEELADLLLSNNILEVNEKDIILNNLLKECFFMMQYRDQSEDKNTNYIDRDKAKHKLVSKEILIRVLISYLGYGQNLKADYKSFLLDYQGYFANIKMIDDILDSNDEEVKHFLKGLLQQRTEAAELLIEKYKSLNVSDMELRSVLEDEMFWMKYEPLVGKELKAFNIA